ncbi:MAG: hypothetical protein OSB82_08620, partial [Alphaproteobacteria bacterium]|nr:hypothetical protein [Alphaproteobacteria bacterium]
FGKLAKGGKVVIDVADGKLTFDFLAKEKPPKRGKRKKDDGNGGGPADPETPGGDKIPELVN